MNTIKIARDCYVFIPTEYDFRRQYLHPKNEQPPRRKKYMVLRITRETKMLPDHSKQGGIFHWFCTPTRKKVAFLPFTKTR